MGCASTTASEMPPWGEEDQTREGGIMQTVPQAIGMLGTPEGRSQFLTGIEKFPADLAKGLVDFFKTPGTATKQGLTPERKSNSALMPRSAGSAAVNSRCRVRYRKPSRQLQSHSTTR